MSVSLATRRPERSASVICIFTLPVRVRRAARSSRILISARTRPSFRVRRAWIPLRIQTSSSASRLSKSAFALSSSASAWSLNCTNLSYGKSQQRTRPRSKSKMRFATRRTKVRSWLTNKSAQLSLVTIPSSHWIAGMSRWFVGSSSSNRSGSCARARAKSVRRFCPPLKLSYNASGSIPVFPKIASAWVSRAESSPIFHAAEFPTETAPITTSRTVPSMCAGISWIMREIRSPVFFTISPDCASVSPESTLKRVLLPQPLRPTRQIRSPASMSKLTLSSNGAFAPIRNNRFWAERIGMLQI